MSDKKMNERLPLERATFYKCPHCGDAMEAADDSSLKCVRKRHSFDKAKHGYYNLMPRPASSPYKKQLFDARHRAIACGSLYAPVHAAIAGAIERHAGSDAVTILDAGCGEGSHLHRIRGMCKGKEITGIGLDIAKDGIAMAAKRYNNAAWIVGDLAQAPLQDKTADVILTMLSPSNYAEFKRLLKERGLVIKAIPRPGYLVELREALYGNSANEPPGNDRGAALFMEHFRLLESYPLTYVNKLSGQMLRDVAAMTPLAWSADREAIDAFADRESAEITIDLEILVGRQ
ncbi:methyltransferase domain-containing protein [Paenibacillus arenilitoris]|uniref:Methyltransferase domain-containing protein n=1 Tax=Paenibacillus arenilitoris TaxID=2772299 RepID=A0A927H4R9_9BACL|nr:methyltransferase domain-containing protein [Paenibacillus arenilitoris]MBD2867677.1 methyltransferase domain-containing protein [Paenibacillus arenilitoris]